MPTSVRVNADPIFSTLKGLHMAHLLSKKVITRLQMIQDSAATKSQVAAA